MFDPRLCLNPNHPDVKKWIDNVGKENMYKVFVQNNYLLPDYESYIGAEEIFSKNIEDYKIFLDNLLPSNQYEFDVLSSLKNNGFNILGTAAFFKKTFYFKDKVTKNELAEEAFHAIVQTLMDEQEKIQIYNGGRELLNQRLKKEKRSFTDYISELEKLFPNTNKEILEQFAYEEEIAKDFVNYYNSEGKINRYSQERINSIANKLSLLGKNALPIAELIHRLFERIKSLFNLTSNEKEVEMLFKKISNGGFKDTKIVNNNDNVIPSFAIYTNSKDRIIPSDEISQMKRSIAVLAKNIFESEGLDLDEDQSVNQAIENYNEFLQKQVEKVFKDKIPLLNDLITLLYNEDEELIQEIKDQFDANKTIFDDDLNTEIEKDEDDLGSNMSFDDGANQQSLESRSKELKILMNTTGTVKGRIYIDTTGKTVAYEDLDTFIITDPEGEVLTDEVKSKYKKIDILHIADEKMIYSAIIRKLTNIHDEKKRLIKLIELSMFNSNVQQIKGKQDNENTKTFINTLLKDILGTPKNMTFEELKEITLKKLVSGTISNVINPESKPLHVQRFLLALRGFNLSTRNVYRVEVDIEKGWGKVADVEASSKKTVQKNYWDSNYRLIELEYEDYKKQFSENYTNFLSEYVKDEKNTIALSIFYNKLLEQLGVDVNGEYLYDFISKITNGIYPILYNNNPFTLTDLRDKLEAFKLIIDNASDYTDIYKGDDEEVEIGVPQSESNKKRKDFNSFFNFIAEGNIEFDERVIESSYKDGYGNSIYNHQLPTYTLKFGTSFDSIEDFNKMKEGEIVGVGVDGELIKSTILDSFKQENPLNDDLTVDGKISEKRLKQVKILTLDTTQLKSYSSKTKDGFLIEKDSEYTENNVIGLDEMSDAEYALTNMILYTEGAKKTTTLTDSFINAPVSLGHNEASKTIDYFTTFHDKEAITLDGKLGEKVKQKIVKLIKTEYNKIKENSEKLKNQIQVLNKTGESGKITRNDLYDLTSNNLIDFEELNVYEGYNNGSYKAIQDENTTYYKAENKKGLKGIQFSPEVEPFVNETLLIQALKGEEFNESNIDFKPVLEFLKEEYNIIKQYGILDKLPYVFRGESSGKNTNGVELFDPKLSTENRVKSFLLNYWIGSTMSNRMRYGSHNFNFKLDSTDPLKRYRMFNGATLSAKTSIKNESLGIYEDINHITYTTIAEPKGKSDINPDDDWIDRADAAMRSTSQGIRRILHGMGKLTKKISVILDKIDQGVELTAKEWDIMVNTQSLIAAMKPLAANGEQTVKTGLTSVLNVATVAYDTIIQSDENSKFEGVKDTFTFGNNQITVDKYGRTSQSVGNTEEIIWDNTNQVFKLWKPKPLGEDLILYSQRMFLRGFRKEDGVWTYKGKQYEIDTLVPPTALKTSQRNILPFVKQDYIKSDGKEFGIEYTNFDFPKKYNNFYTFANAIDASYFGQQVDNPQGKVKITSPTQNIEILANEQFGDITIKIFENGKYTEQTISNAVLQEYYQKMYANRNLNGKNLAVSELFTEKDGKLVPNYTYFFEKLKEGLKLTGGSGQDYEFLEVNDDGTPKYNVNIPLNKDKMIQYVLKHFSTGVLSHKVAGNSYVLASDYGMKSLKKVRLIKDKDGNIIDYTWDVIHNKTEGYNDLLVGLANKGLEDLSDKIYDHRAYQLGIEQKNQTLKEKSELHTWFEEQKEKLLNGEDVYFIDGLRYMKKSYTKVDGKDVFNTWTSEAMMPKLNAKQKSISEAIKFGTGVRIPSQDKQSAIGLEWVDFLDDTLGNTIVVPKEIVQIAGSDFDIDKSYVTQYEGYWENGEYIKYEDTFTDYKKYLFKTSKPLKKALKEIGNEEEVLKKFGLISTEKEFELESKKLKEKDKNASLNNAVLNNKILDAQRALLTSESVLFGDINNPARGTGDTPMDLTLLKDLQKNSFVAYLKNEDNRVKIEKVYGKNIKIEDFTDKEGVDYYHVYPYINIVKGKTIELLQVFKNSKIPHNALTVHSNYQQGTIIARRGIGVTVNGLLQAIVANRIKLPLLTDKFKLSYNGEDVEFGYTDHKGNRVFAIKNTLVSAATDEAKEEQLKRHGIKGDDLNVVDLLTNFGFTIDESIAIVNSKQVKRYKDNVSKNNLELKSDRNKPKSEEQKKFDDLIQQLKSNNNSINLTPQKIFESLYQEDNDILETYLKISDMSKELSKVAKLIKGKKGYTKGKLSELTDIQNTALELGLIPTSTEYEPTGYFDWRVLNSNKAADIKSFVEITQDLTNSKLNQMFFEYESISTNLKNTVLTETNKPDNTELADKVEKDVNTFMIVQMIKAQENNEDERIRNKYKYLNDFLNINKINPSNKVDNFVSDFFVKKKLSKKGDTYKLLKHLIGVKGKVNTIKNSESIDSLRLAAVSKLNPAQQDNIRNLFLEMYYSDNQDEKIFAQNLFAYFLLKDGLQFRQFNISKIFPTEMFQEVSDVLNDFKNFTNSLNNEQTQNLTKKFKQLWYSDIRNKKYRQKIKDSEVVKAYHFKKEGKTFQKEFKIGEPPLYIEIDKNANTKELNKSNVKFESIGDQVRLILPQYFDYNGYSFKRIATDNENVYSFIREPYYGSTIIDMTVDAGVIPATSEVAGKNGNKLVDLIEQLKSEGTKKGYIQYYENLLLNRYSPNFDKSYKEETVKKEVENINIFDTIKSANESSIKFNSSSGDTTWLSNFEKLKNPIMWDNNNYYTVEAFYQAMKTENKEERKQFQSFNLTGNQAKQLGKKVKLRLNWDKIKYKVMEEGIKQKFDNNPLLKEKLINTGDLQLVEWNTWGDKTWGITANDNKGKNALGVILENQREIYKDNFTNRKLKLPQETQSEFDNFVDDVLMGIVDYKNSNPFENIIELKEGSGFEVVGNTIEYTPKGKEIQTYTIIGNKIYNKNNQEVFSEDSVDRNKIFANLAVKQGRAVVVNYKDTNYVVNNKDQIISTVSGKIMEWEDNNGNRVDILKLAKDKFKSKNKPQQEQEVIQQLKNDIISRADTSILPNQGRRNDSEYLTSLQKAATVLGESSNDTSLFNKISGKTFKEVWDSNEFTETERKRYMLLGIQQKLYQKNTFNGNLSEKIDKKLGIKVRLNIDNNSDYTLFIKNGELIVNPDKLYIYLTNNQFENIDEYLDLTVAEELIHIVTQKITTFEDTKSVIIEQIKNNSEFMRNLSYKYKDLKSNDFELAYYEYVRMLVQQEFLGTTTEQVKYTRGGIIDEIITKVWEFLKSVASLPKTKEVIQKHIDFIKNDIEFENQDSEVITPLDTSSINQEGIDFVFEQNPELANIGTKEQYGEYIKTIFPESRVKDIVYHGSPLKNLQKLKRGDDNFDKMYTSKYGIAFSDNNLIASYYAGQIDFMNFESEDDYSKGQVYNVILNIKNPKIKDFKGSSYKESIGDYNISLEEAVEKENKDSFIANNISDPIKANSYIVFKPEQIHILGNEEDQEMFNNFVKNQFLPIEESNFDINIPCVKK